MNKGSKLMFFIVYILLGLVIALQYRTTLDANKEKSASVLNVDRLRIQLEQEKKIEDELKAKVEEYNKKIEEHLINYIEINDDAKLRVLWEELNKLKFISGLTDVEGPGIILTLDDAPARKTDKPSKLIIHDGDIKKILNELKIAGAQAISINGERIVSTSEQVCAGPTIRINKERYSVPYIINVIGPPEQLFNAIIESDRINIMRKDGIVISVNKYNKVIVPKYDKEPKRVVNNLEVVENEY
ncbi:MAG TPA: DUF881 domain-containing protein [Clostridiaceae bacterium]|jgi:uncharacterized protein YlxW (UPF0749 family)|nr:DUF881 domain-containing protein [Clostridiaceae bacterium]